METPNWKGFNQRCMGGGWAPHFLKHHFSISERSIHFYLAYRGVKNNIRMLFTLLKRFGHTRNRSTQNRKKHAKNCSQRQVWSPPSRKYRGKWRKTAKNVLVELPSCRSPELRTSITILDVPRASYVSWTRSRAPKVDTTRLSRATRHFLNCKA